MGILNLNIRCRHDKGADTAFRIALWRIDPAIKFPPYMPALFSDWVKIAVSPQFYTDRLLPCSTTTHKHGCLSSYCGPTQTASILADWKKTLLYFVIVITITRGMRYSEYAGMLPLLGDGQDNYVDRRQFLQQYEIYKHHAEDIINDHWGFLGKVIQDYIF